MASIGNHVLATRTILAPMAGVTDRPFRQLCKRLGAAMTVSEMVTSDTRLWHTRKSQQRLPHLDEPSPRSVQIAGSIPQMMAEAARQNVALGAEIIDINMGCPAKKVCKRAAGSALLKDEPLVTDILNAVVAAVEVPVTLKIRTGWDTGHRNAVTIARLAEDCGIQALAVHGRTRACRFNGNAEYDTIAAVVQAVSMPVFANGDICTPQQAKQVLDHTGADAVMIGRAAQGNPWLFREINHYLATGTLAAPPTKEELAATICDHICAIHQHYGEYLGTRIARKHVGWYVGRLPSGETFRKYFNQLDTPSQQQQSLKLFLTGQEEWDTAA
ncbi:MAG: tRNA dihydrouridine synthase DusB [Gammaproteobacteria bacterium]|nr:MAG: tRNA dihydrouridine synthase DusB [Gammaproteobacteria bacterium]